jgi:hypothetical protein
MSDPTTPDARARAGTPADRSPFKDAGSTAIGAGALGVLIGTGDWLSEIQAAHHYVPPEHALVVIYATALAPIARLIYKIWINRLEKAAGETP